MVQTSTQTIVVGGRVRAPLALSTDLVLRGTVAIVGGVVALAWPEPSLTVAGYVLAGSVLAVGACELVDGIRRRHFAEEWAFALLRGLVLLGVGGYLVGVADGTVGTLASGVGAAWASTGGLEVVEGVRARRGVREARFRVLRGLVTVAGGLTMALVPGLGVTALARTSGVMLVVLGLLCFPSAFVLRQVGQLQRPVRLDVVR